MTKVSPNCLLLMFSIAPTTWGNISPETVPTPAAMIGPDATVYAAGCNFSTIQAAVSGKARSSTHVLLPTVPQSMRYHRSIACSRQTNEVSLARVHVISARLKSRNSKFDTFHPLTVTIRLPDYLTAPEGV
jgi:hypothetical protein